MENTLYKEITKQDRFEILAMMREARKKSGHIEIAYDDKILSCPFLQVDLNGFHVAWMEELSAISEFLPMVIKGSGEKIEFNAQLQSIDQQAGHLVYGFPEEIVVIQRRQSMRITVPDYYGFRCEGRFRDGFNYTFAIKDLSAHGLQLQCTQPLPNLTRNGMLLKNMTIHLGKFGSWPVDLNLLNMKALTHIDDEGQTVNWHTLSCMFAKPAPAFVRKMEEVVMELILDLKRTKRLR